MTEQEIGVISAKAAEAAVKALNPPSIKYRKIEDAVGGSLHTRGAGGLKRPTGVVQPNVTTLNQVTGCAHIVVLKEYDSVAKLRPAREVRNLGDQFLAAMIMRVGLAREDHLDRVILA